MSIKSDLEQVKSGFRIAGWTISSVVFAGLLLKAETWAVRPESPLQRVAGAVGIAVLGCILFLSARWWWKGFLGLVAFCLLRSLILLIFPNYRSNPDLSHKIFSRIELLEYQILFIALLVLGYQFGPRWKIPESLAAAVTVISLGVAVVIGSPYPIVFAAGSVALAWVIQSQGWQGKTAADEFNESEPEQFP